jgi:hypothetical protein
MLCTTLCYDLLQRTGVFDTVRDFCAGTQRRWEEIKEMATEASETAQWARKQWEWFYSFVSVFMEPWRAVLYILAGIYLVRQCLGEDVADSPTSSVASSGASSTAQSGSASPATAEAAQVIMTHGLLEQVSQRLEKIEAARTQSDAEIREIVATMKENLSEQDIRAQAVSMRSEVSGEGWRASDRNAVQELVQRVESFRTILEEDRGEKGKMRGELELVKAKLASSASSSEAPPFAAPSMAAAVAGSSSQSSFQVPGKKDAEVGELVRKLAQRAEQPPVMFMEHLKHFKVIPEKVWSEHFPPGYRTRIGPAFVAEIMQSGKNCEMWAREHLQTKGAMESKAARELIPTLMTLDSMLFVDKDYECINRIGFERLARKGLAIVEGWRQVQTKADWSKPAGAPKSWKSKVDMETAKRIDPFLIEGQTFQIRELQDEIRKETEREANLLKARTKLEKHGGASQEEG